MREKLAQRLTKMGIVFPPDAPEKLELYAKILVEYNKKVNLTAILDEEGIISKHFLDSAAILSTEYVKADAKIIDIGTGAGFPGMVIKTLRPDVHMTLLDSHSKRMDFLKYLCGELDIMDVELITGRAEDFGRKAEYRESFNLAFSRAVAKLNILTEICTPFIRVGGHFIALKGQLAEQEVQESKRAFFELGCEEHKIIKIEIPETQLAHAAVIINRTKTVPQKYPRNYSKISKMPL